MNHQHPIFTVETECQDCYKCLRHCPVKAIRVENGHAMVMPDTCVSCGACVEACPVHAKRIRDDFGRAKQLVQSDRPVYVSLAPSWVSEFPGVTERGERLRSEEPVELSVGYLEGGIDLVHECFLR